MVNRGELYFARINKEGSIIFCNDAFKQTFHFSSHHNNNVFSQLTGVAPSLKNLNSFSTNSKTANNISQNTSSINWQFIEENEAINCIGTPTNNEAKTNEAETNRQILKAIFESTHNVKFFVAPDYSILFFNKKAYDNGLALHGEELKVGDSILHYAKDTKNEIDKHFIKKFQRAIKGEIVSDEQFIEYANHNFWFHSEFAPIYNNNQLLGIAITVTDITQRKELEQQKTSFIGIVSHELKTPVTSLKAYCQIIIQKLKKQEYISIEGMLDRMNLQINRLNNIIRDLLDVTRIQGVKLKFREEVFSLKDLVIQIVEEVQRTTDTHKIIIQTTQTAQVNADKERIGQVLINLLTNAIRYSPHAAEVWVNMHCTNSEVTCSIKDFGIGIPKDKQAHLFERFYRVNENEKHNNEGLGLGLYIADQIIHRQNGKLSVDSEPNAGATFYFSLPLYK